MSDIHKMLIKTNAKAQGKDDKVKDAVKTSPGIAL